MLRRKNWKQLIGILSVVAITISSLPANVLAEGDVTNPVSQAEEQEKPRRSNSEDMGIGSAESFYANIDTLDNRNSSTVNNDTTNNDTVNNDTTNNDTVNNDTTNNDTVNNDTTNNDTVNNDTTNNDTVNNDTTNNTVNNDMTNNDTVNNDTTNNDTVNNDTSNTQANVTVAIETKSDSLVIGKTGESDRIELTANIGNYEGTWTCTWTGSESISISNAEGDSVTVTGSKAGTAQVTVTVSAEDGTVLGTDTMDLEVWTDRVISSKVYTATPNGHNGATGKAFTGEVLKWTVESSNDNSTNIDSYSFQWLRKEEGEYKTVAGATGFSYQPEKEGVYKVKVSRAEGDCYNAYTAESEEITVTKAPVIIVWPGASRYYVSGNKTFEYSGTSKAMVMESVSGESYENEALSVEISKKTYNLEDDSVGTYTIYPNNGVDTEKYDVTDNGAAVQIKETELPVTVKLSDKYFDNTTDLDADTKITVTFRNEYLAQAGLSPETSLVHKDGTALSADDFIIASAGAVDSDTEVAVNFKDGIELAVMTKNGISTDFTADVTVEKIVIRKNEWTLDQVGTMKDSEGAVYTDAEGVVWTRTGDDGTTVELVAAEGYKLSDSLDGLYGNTVNVSLGSDVYLTFYAMDENGLIAKINYEDAAIDNDAPYADLQKSSYKIFDRENRVNTYYVKDEGCGIKDAAYIISDTNINPDYSDESQEWTHIRVTDDAATVELTVPAFGYVYFYLEDNLGNSQIKKLHMVVLENGKPSVTVNTEEADISGAKISFSAADEGNEGKTPSGVAYIVFNLKDSEGKEVGDSVTYLMEKKEGYVQEGSRVGRTESPDSIEELPEYTVAEGVVSLSTKNLEGTYILTVSATDFCGNTGDEVTTELVFDSKEPEVTVSMNNGNLVNDVWYYRQSNCGITVSFSDLNLAEGGTYEAAVSDEAGHILTKNVAVDDLAKTTEKTSLSFPATDVATLTEGKITVSVTASDVNGNAIKSINGNNVTVNGTTAIFILDMTAPMIISADRKGNLIDRVFEFFGASDSVMELTVKDNNIDESLLSGSSTKGKVEFETKTSDGLVKAIFTMRKNKYGYLVLDGKDYAGNVLRVSPDYKHDYYSVWVNTKTGATTDKTYEIVTDNPVVSIIYKNGENNLDSRFVYGTDAYFSSTDARAVITLSDVVAEDYPYIFAALVASDADPETAEYQVFESDTMTLTLPADGAYYVLIKGTNRAMTTLTVEEQNLKGGAASSEKLASADTVYTSVYKLIRDTKAPAAVMTITPGEGTEKPNLNTEYGNRYYFNKNFTYEVVVSDINLDEEASSVHVVQAFSDNYEDSSQVMLETEDCYTDELTGTYNAELNAGVFTTQITTDGVYRFAVYGEDLAGNAVELGSVRNTDSSYTFKQENCNDTKADTSQIVVLDKVIPFGKISVSAGENIVYEMSSDGQASVVKPYINKEKVLVTASVDESEKTPCYISFKVNENQKPAEETVVSEEYKIGQTLETEVKASQVFTVSEMSITDLAGNGSEATPESRKLYLDIDIPDKEHGDAIAPLINISALNTSSYGEEGAPLFNGDSDAVFSVKVADPYAPDESSEEEKEFSSSGLAQVSWKLVNTENEKELISSTDLYKYDGVFYPTAEEAANEVYTYAVDEKVTISKDSFNYNTLKLVVNASDNAGNEYKAEYAFGIDSTAPEVKVVYYNNDVSSEKYFAGKRTAVVTVKERNFDPDKLQMVVTGDGEGSNAENAGVVKVPDAWEYTKGSGNGDDDTYSKTIVFEHDGHYTLHVTSATYGQDMAEDHVGNKGTVTYDGKAPNDFYIDTMGPEIKFLMSLTEEDRDPDGSYYYRADNCGVQVVFSDHGKMLGTSDGSVENYSISIDGSNKKEFTSFGSGQNEISLSYSKEELSKTRIVEDGEHTITITAADASGNKTTKVMDGSHGAIFKETNAGPSAVFVLDTVNPIVTEISTDAVDGNNSGMSDLSVYADTNSAYYNKDLKITLNVKDQNVSTDSFSGTMDAEKGDAVSAGISSTSDGLKAVYSLKANNAYSDLVLQGYDKAGNAIVLSSDYVHDNCDTLNADYGQIRTVYEKVIDTINPTVTIEYVSDDYANMYSGETEGKDSAYYNKDITVKMSVADNYELDGKKLSAGLEAETGSLAIPDNTREFICDDIVIREEGRYSYSCSGTDRALNKTKVKEMVPKTDDNPSVTYLAEEEASEFVSKYELILDKTAPTFVFDIQTEAVNKDLSTQGNRFYFNTGYVATLTVTDTNFDSEKVELKKGFLTSGSYDSSKAVIDSFGESVTSDSNVYVDEADSTNGVFRYVMFGSDKAGNALAAENKANLDGTVNSAIDAATEKSRGSLETEADASCHIVVDTEAPKGKLEISKTKTSEPYYIMDTSERVSRAEPYRNETTAYIHFTIDTESEHTPVKINYEVLSTIGEGNAGKFEGSGFEYNASASKEQNGQQIFRVSSYKLTDLAGNSVECSSKNKIYLDVEAPVEDTLAPTINISATATADCRDGKGQPLFNKDVPLKIVVDDVKKNSNSAGLGTITYEIYVNGNLVKDEVKQLHDPVQKSHQQAYNDAELDYKMEKIVTVASGSHNYNDLRVLIKAYDNAGNYSERDYVFGIDITKPTISVDFDNDSAQNGKYFKANRVATVVVKERNFDRSLIKITTENSASISGWSHEKKPGNGDADEWSCKITYAKDGNYHLTLAGSDMLGWNAESITYKGTAPRDFVIDKTAPKVAVTYNNNSVQNGKYYKDPRTATVSVTDVNYNGANAIKVSASGGGNAPGVRFNGKTATLPFNTDGIYKITGTVTDMAGNVSNVLDEPEFVIDQMAPEISLTGVEDLSANNVPLDIVLKMVDTNYNPNGFEPVLKGTNNGKVTINGEPKYVDDGITYVLDTIDKDDYYELTYTATDLAGNTSNMSVSFSENRNGTSFKFVQEEYNGKSTNQSFNPEFILSNIDEITIMSVTLNGKETPYTFKKNHLVLDTKTDTDGKYTITIDTRDAAGNMSSMDPVEFQIDTKAPVLTVDGLNENTKYYFEEFNLTFYHDNPVDDFSVIRMNGVDLDKSQYLINDDGSITIHIGQYQDYDIEIQVADAAGNISEFGNIHFTMTRNPFIRWYSNTPLFLFSLVVLTAIIVWFILLWKRRKDEDEEEQAAKA